MLLVFVWHFVLRLFWRGWFGIFWGGCLLFAFLMLVSLRDKQVFGVFGVHHCRSFDLLTNKIPGAYQQKVLSPKAVLSTIGFRSKINHSKKYAGLSASPNLFMLPFPSTPILNHTHPQGFS